MTPGLNRFKYGRTSSSNGNVPPNVVTGKKTGKMTVPEEVEKDFIFGIFVKHLKWAQGDILCPYSGSLARNKRHRTCRFSSKAQQARDAVGECCQDGQDASRVAGDRYHRVEQAVRAARVCIANTLLQSQRNHMNSYMRVKW